MRYAIVGASNNKEKYGYKVLKDLKEKGMDVVPINPAEEEIQGLKSYKALIEFPEKIDMAIFVIPPEITELILREVNQIGIKKVWFQPGSESKKAISFCKENDIEYTANSCIMIKG